MLCSVYERDITYLIESLYKLGQAYRKYGCLEQAQEKIVESLKLIDENKEKSQESWDKLEDLQALILLQLGKILT